MKSRRRFLQNITLASFGLIGASACKKIDNNLKINKTKNIIKEIPIVISTWKHGLPANEKAWNILINGGRALDAVEQGVRIPESDPDVTSVGYGGLPDRDGKVTLDSCIIDETGNCGSVGCIQDIKNPISVARLVMEKTPHVMIVGEGATNFAVDNGFKLENLLTKKAKLRWEEWMKNSNYSPKFSENHDTIGMIAIDKKGNLSGACTTSGLAWKYHGRVGDSPIIGAGLFVDNEVGGAAATGVGEAVMKTLGTFLIVEQMRMGKSPQEACEIAIDRISHKVPNYKDIQVGFIAVNKLGQTGAFSLKKGFEYALYQNSGNKLINSKYLLRG